MRSRIVPVLFLATVARWTVAGTLPPAQAAGADAENAGLVRADHVQVVTVTDTGAAIAWETARVGSGGVRFGTAPRSLDRRAAEIGPPRRFHQCRLTGLKPGTKYYFACDDGPQGRPSSTLSFTTLTPPPGRELFAFATMTDTHFGQQVVGRIVVGTRVLYPGVSWREPQVPLWKVAIQPAIEEINSTDCAFAIIKGDVTHGLQPREFRLAHETLAGLAKPCHVVRGNHDDLGLWLRTFGLREPWYSFDHEGFHFVILHTEVLVGGPDGPRQEQLRWLAADLARNRDRWTFVFLHRPIQPVLSRSSGDDISDHVVDAASRFLARTASPTLARTLEFATGRLQDVAEPYARPVAELLTRHGRIAGVFAGHVHRNYVGAWPEQTGNLPYVETAAAGEFPCGYAMTRVFTGGYMQNFYMPDDARCLEWSALTRDAFEHMGLGAKIGTLADRNFVVRFDDLNLKPARVEP